MKCLDTIDAGSAQARAELLFLAVLLGDLGYRIEPGTDLSGSLGFTDVYRCPACRTDDFIRMEKASVSLLEDLAALRVLARERVRQLVERLDHRAPAGARKMDDAAARCGGGCSVASLAAPERS